MLPLAYHSSDVAYRLRDYSESEMWLSPVGGVPGDVLVVSPLEVNNEFKDKDFEVHFLVNAATRENDVFQYYHKKARKRIGWIIPVAALDSDQHDFASNEHFLKYAWVAMRLALNSEGGASVRRKVDVAGRESISFSELFDPNAVILVISRETLVDGCEFEFERAVLPLAMYGYVSASSVDPSQVQFVAAPPQGVKLTFELTSNDLGHADVIASLLNGCATSQSELLRFFFLYQIVELFIDRIFAEEQGEIVRELVEAGGDSSRIKDALYEMGNLANEKKRISKLVTDYSGVIEGMDALQAACNDFLGMVKKKRGATFDSFLYPVRNFVFHNFRQVPSEALATLGDVNRALLKVLSYLSSSFQVPHKS